ncbi:alpha/beta hydrolase-fold protein [Actinoallomurus sp. NPDC050550]|uniref:alpha/beta hydrolase n=1 Tax=Actinoallomurus sp. NPDC050550 TaxID=3154937 RepID=UPI0033C18CF6
MSLLGLPLLVLSILLAVTAPVGCALLWGRVRGAGAWPVRVSLIVLSQVTAVLVAGVGLNDHFEFFASWSDLTGQNGADAPIQQQNGGSEPLGRGLSQRLRKDFRPDHGKDTFSATLVGAKSGIRSKIWVWLPPQYQQHPRQRFPVIELFPGFPGTPVTWLHTMQGPKKLQEAMKKGAAQPYILVAPTITVVPGHDTECANVPHGPKVATWLAEDVRRIVTENFRALPDRDGWGTMGYSTGGYCAAKLTAQYPHLFRAGVSMSGYFTPSTAALAKAPGENVPALLETRHPPIDLLLTASKQDPGTTSAVDTMVKAARPPSIVYTYVVPRGGHNIGVWTAMLPKCFQWLTTKLTHAS